MTLREARARFFPSTPAKKLRRLCEQGHLPAHKFGALWFVSAPRLEALLRGSS